MKDYYQVDVNENTTYEPGLLVGTVSTRSGEFELRLGNGGMTGMLYNGDGDVVREETSSDGFVSFDKVVSVQKVLRFLRSCVRTT